MWLPEMGGDKFVIVVDYRTCVGVRVVLRKILDYTQIFISLSLTNAFI
jgi:hypothetical protein